MDTDSKTSSGRATPSGSYWNFNMSDGSNQNKALVEKYIGTCTRISSISEDKKTHTSPSSNAVMQRYLDQ